MNYQAAFEDNDSRDNEGLAWAQEKNDTNTDAQQQ